MGSARGYEATERLYVYDTDEAVPNHTAAFRGLFSVSLFHAVSS